MGDFGGTKLQAAKIAAKAIVESLVPPPDGFDPTGKIALVTFADDATTQFGLTSVSGGNAGFIEGAIDTLTSGGWTSIGDGVLEAQSLLGQAFDPPPGGYGGTLPTWQTMTVLSDGINNRAWNPNRYYVYAPDAHHDGNGPWIDGPLSRPDRTWAGYSLPNVSTIAIGQDADLSELEALARYGGGTSIYLPGPESATKLTSASLDFSDAFGSAFAEGTGYDRIGSARASTTGALTAIDAGTVEPGATELRVVLTSAAVSLRFVQLVHEGDASPIAPTSTSADGSAVAFRIPQPAPGAWHAVVYAPDAPSTSEPAVFLESTVRAPAHLFALADAEAVRPLPANPGPDDAYEPAPIGSDIVLRSSLDELGPQANCNAVAVVTAPPLPALVALDRRFPVALWDDGAHDDGEAGDGVFGARFRTTGVAGMYDIRFTTTCVSSVSGATIRREARRAVTLGAPVDSDGDGMFDAWETLYGLNPQDPSDAASDLDGDGVANVLELHYRTNPANSDTDGGGESDGSELAAGRDPLDGSDDVAKAPFLSAMPGNGKVVLAFGMSTSGLRLHVQRAASALGPFRDITSEAGRGALAFADDSASNEADACYRVRTLDEAGNASGWSRTSCVRPRPDPDSPQLAIVAAPASAHSREVTLTLSGADVPHRVETFGLDRGVLSSGLSELRVGFGPDLSAVTWQPFTTSIAVRLPDAERPTVWLQARDYAGNASAPIPVAVPLSRATSLDRAIALEERAQDAAAQRDWATARANVTSSLTPLRRSIAIAVERIARAHGKPTADDLHLLATLQRILVKKEAAVALLRPLLAVKGLALLNEALDLERELSAWADARRISP